MEGCLVVFPKTLPLKKGLWDIPGAFFILTLNKTRFQAPADTHFSPIIELINKKIKKTRQNAVGSLKTKIPTKTVPTAPIPVQTA